MSELKRCPFCGERAMITTYLGTTEVDIECCDCSCKITGCNKEDAIKAWNTRKPMERIVERLEELKKQYIDKANETPNSAMRILFSHKVLSYSDAVKIVKEEGGMNERI